MRVNPVSQYDTDTGDASGVSWLHWNRNDSFLALQVALQTLKQSECCHFLML